MKALVITLVVANCMAIFLTGYFYSRDNKYSRFYDDQKGLERLKIHENKSWNESRAFLSRFLEAEGDREQYRALLNSKGTHQKLCFGVGTLERPKKLEYYERTLAYLLNRLGGPLYSYKDTVYVFNMEPNPEFHTIHTSNHKFWSYVPISEYYQQVKHTKWFQGLDFSRQRSANIKNEKMDTALALHYLLKQGNCSFMVYLQDDAIVSRDIVSRIQSAVEQVEEQEAFEQRKEAAFMRLFVYDNLDSWDTVQSISFLVGVTIFGGLLLVLVFNLQLIAFHKLAPGRSSLKRLPTLMNAVLFVIFASCISCTLVLCSPQAFKKLYSSPKSVSEGWEHASLVAQMYNRNGADSFIGWITENLRDPFHNIPIDILLRGKIQNSKIYRQVVLNPNPVQHIGRISTLRRVSGLERNFLTSASFPKADESF